MIGIFTANTEGWKKLTHFSSYGIKIFTYYIIRPEVRKYFGITSLEQCPTHSLPIGEKTETNKWLILDANKTMELNYLDIAYPSLSQMKLFSFVENHKEVYYPEYFHKLVNSKVNNLYGLWEWFNFIRRALWMWIFRRDIKGSHQYFAWLDMCSEITARYADQYKASIVKRLLSQINYNVIAPADLLNIIYDGIQAGEMIEIKNLCS